MNDMTTVTGLRPLKAAEVPETAIPCLSVPQAFPLPDMDQGRAPDAVYEYRNSDSSLACLIARNSHTGGKWFCPFTVWTIDGEMHWAAKALPGQTPLYHLPELVARPDKPVLVSEGEKCADRAAAFDRYVSVTWRNGSNGLSKSDFTSLKGRDVILVPDDDGPGAKAAEELREILKRIGVARLRVFDIGLYATMNGCATGAGYDIADAIEAGLTEERFTTLLACDDMVRTIDLTSTEDEAQSKENPVYRELRQHFDFEPKLRDGFELTVDGIFKHDVDGRGRPITIWAGSPMVVLGRTRLAEERRGWGYLIAVRTPEGDWDCQTVSGRLLAGDGRELRETMAELFLSR